MWDTLMANKYQYLNALAEIRDYLRERNHGIIPDGIREDFNLVAKKLGAESDWCVENPTIYYVTRILDRGGKTEHLITWEGPFKTLQIAKEKLRILQTVQPQFEFVIEQEDESGRVTRASDVVLETR